MYSVYASQEGSKEIIPGENMGTLSSTKLKSFSFKDVLNRL